MTMRAVLVDDEPQALALLERYLGHFSGVEVVASFRNGVEALEFLAREAVDLVFLDIGMPQLSGLALARQVAPGTRVIFTTAHAEHALESYEVNAVDYLLKPIAFDRFAAAMGKVLASGGLAKAQVRMLWVKSGSRTHRIDPREVRYLKKEGNYIAYFLEQGRVLVRASIAEAMAELPAGFVRIHRSYIVNKAHVRAVDRHEVLLHSGSLPVGAAFRQAVQAAFVT